MLKLSIKLLNPPNFEQNNSFSQTNCHNTRPRIVSIMPRRIQQQPAINLRDIFNRMLHILNGILECLSASDSSSFLSILCFRMAEYLWQTASKKYVDPIRDLSDYAQWMKQMISKEHKVFLIGVDVIKWFKRVHAPSVYWREYRTALSEKPLRLWMAVRTARKLYKQKIDMPQGRYEVFSITSDGDGVLGAEAATAKRQGALQAHGTVIPPPGEAIPRRDTYVSSSQDRVEWRRCSNLKENLQIVWAHFPGHDDTLVMSLRARTFK